MTPGYIFRKTMIFNWIKLGIGVLTLFVAMLAAAVVWLILMKTSFSLMTQIAIGCGGFLVTVAIYYLIMSRMGYSVITGHLAIIERAHGGADIPPNPVEYSKTIVQERFGSNAKFYAISRNVSTSVRQMRRVIMRGFSLDKDTPDMSPFRRVIMLLSHSALSYMKDCCLAYALSRRDYEVNAAVADALTIMAQCWDKVVRSALRLSLIVIVLCSFLFVIFFLPGLAICNAMSLSSLPWIWVSLFLAITFKIAFFDSWVLTKMVCSFLDIAKNTQIEQKNYIKLDTWSKVYAKIRKDAETAAEKAEDAQEREARKARKAEKRAKAMEATTDAGGMQAESVEEDSQSSEATAEDSRLSDVTAEDSQLSDVPAEDSRLEGAVEDAEQSAEGTEDDIKS